MTKSGIKSPFIIRYPWGIAILALFIGFVCGFTTYKMMFAPAPAPVESTICGLKELPKSSEVYGLVSNQSEYDRETAAYQAANPESTDHQVTWGGVIGKQYMIALINSLGTRDALMYKFATDATTGYTCLYFQGGGTDPVTGAATTSWYYFRTGNSRDAYCPIVCDVH